MNFNPITDNRATVIAVDFDGCLVADRYPRIGQENDELFRALIKFRSRGGKVILWTCRCGDHLRTAIRYCAAMGLRFDAVNRNLKVRIDCYGTDSRKISADYYIDDNAVKVAWKGTNHMPGMAIPDVNNRVVEVG